MGPHEWRRGVKFHPFHPLWLRYWLLLVPLIARYPVVCSRGQLAKFLLLRAARLLHHLENKVTKLVEKRLSTAGRNGLEESAE